jgi:hypothetical protein
MHCGCCCTHVLHPHVTRHSVATSYHHTTRTCEQTEMQYHNQIFAPFSLTRPGRHKQGSRHHCRCSAHAHLSHPKLVTVRPDSHARCSQGHVCFPVASASCVGFGDMASCKLPNSHVRRSSHAATCDSNERCSHIIPLCSLVARIR